MATSLLVKDPSKQRVPISFNSSSSKSAPSLGPATSKIDTVKKMVAKAEKTKVQRPSSSRRSSSSKQPMATKAAAQELATPSIHTIDEGMASGVKTIDKRLQPVSTILIAKTAQQTQIERGKSISDLKADASRLRSERRDKFYTTTPSSFSVADIGRGTQDPRRTDVVQTESSMKKGIDTLPLINRLSMVFTPLAIPLSSEKFQSKKSKDLDKNTQKLEAIEARIDAKTRASQKEFIDSKHKDGRFGIGTQELEELRSGSMSSGFTTTRAGKKRLIDVEADIFEKGRELPSSTAPSEIAIRQAIGKPAPAVEILSLQSEKDIITDQLSERPIHSTELDPSLLTLEALKEDLASSKIRANAPRAETTEEVAGRAKSSIVRGTVEEGVAVGLSVGLSVGAVKLAQTGSKAFKTVRFIDKLDQVSDTIQAVTGGVQIATGDIAGGARNLGSLATTEFAAGRASSKFARGVDFDTGVKPSLKDKFFPAGVDIEFTGANLKGEQFRDPTPFEARTFKSVEGLSQEQRTKMMLDDKPNKVIELTSGEVQIDDIKFMPKKQTGILYSANNKPVRRNIPEEKITAFGTKLSNKYDTLTDSFGKFRIKGKKANLAIDSSPDAFSSQFDITPSTQFEIGPKTSFDTVIDTKVAAVKPDSLGSLKANPAVSGKISVKADFSSKLGLKTGKIDTFALAGITPAITPTVKPAITPTIKETIKTDFIPDLTPKLDVDTTPNYTSKLTPGLSTDFTTKFTPGAKLDLTPTFLGKPKRGVRRIKGIRGYKTFTIENKVLDISQGFKSKVKQIRGKTRTRTNEVYIPKGIKRFL